MPRNTTLKRSGTSRNIDQSGLVSSGQTGIHPHLERCLLRHLRSPWLEPLHKPTVKAFEQFQDEIGFNGQYRLVLDSGCGTGKSTQRLAELYPDQLVIGVDQSLSRLARTGRDPVFSRSGNCILLRAELSSFWRLLLSHGITLDRHYLLYPNPWPKPGHLQRRWHGHPVFPTLLALGGEIEMRCNWEIYALEFAMAVNFVTGGEVIVERIYPETGLSPFEQKYLERRQVLYSVKLPGRSTD